MDDERHGGLAPLARLVRAERGRRRVRGERRHDRPAVAAALARLARRLDRRRGDGGRDQHVDRAAAREPDVPRLLVADPVADDALAGRPCGPPRSPRPRRPRRSRRRRSPRSGRRRSRAGRRPRAAAREPNVRTTTARPTPAPSAVQPASVSSSSCMRVSSGCQRSGRARSASWCGVSTARGGAASGAMQAERRRDARRMGDGGSPARGSLARPGEHLAQPLERGERAGRQEVVDEREGGLHPRGERLVARRRGQRVEPHEPVAVAPQPRGLGGDERRVAAVPAVATRRSRCRSSAASGAPTCG